MPRGVPQWQYDQDVRALIIDERAWLRMAVSTLIDLSMYLMAAHDNEQTDDLKAGILTGVRDLLQEEREARDERWERLNNNLHRLNTSVEEHQRHSERRLNWLDDKRTEAKETSDKRYRELKQEILGLKDLVNDIERRLDDLEALKQDELTARQLNDIESGS